MRLRRWLLYKLLLQPPFPPTPEVQSAGKEVAPEGEAIRSTSDTSRLHSIDFSRSSIDGCKPFMELFDKAVRQNEESNRLLLEELTSLMALKHVHTVSRFLFLCFTFLEVLPIPVAPKHLA